MYRKHHTKGVVVSGRIEGDNNRRLDIFTEDFGLISARVQGARNIRSKMRGSSQDFAFGEFSLVHGKSGWKVVSVRSEKNFFEILRDSPSKLKMASNILNLIKTLTDEEENKTPLLDVVTNFFIFLKKADEDEVPSAECLTILRVLHILGYMKHPEISIPLSSTEIETEDLETITPRRSKIVQLINESLKAV